FCLSLALPAFIYGSDFVSIRCRKLENRIEDRNDGLFYVPTWETSDYLKVYVNKKEASYKAIADKVREVYPGKLLNLKRIGGVCVTDDEGLADVPFNQPFEDWELDADISDVEQVLTMCKVIISNQPKNLVNAHNLPTAIKEFMYRNILEAGDSANLEVWLC